MDVVKDLDCQYVEEHELVTSYLAGRLSEDEAEAFEKHYFGCEKCWAEVRAGNEIRAALKGHAGGATVRRGPWTNWKLLAIAAAVGVVVFGGLLFVRNRDGSDIRMLAAALAFKSPVEARLTGFTNGPRQSERSLSPPVSSPSGETLEAIGRIKSRAERSATAANLAALGVAELVIGEEEDSVKSLETATEMEPTKGRFWNDLSAAYLAAGKKLDRPDLIGKALSAAEKAISIEPSLVDAYFNRALALEELPLQNEARLAWQEYLRRDSTSPWAQEARRRIARLSVNTTSRVTPADRERLLQAARENRDEDVSKIVARLPQASREWIEDLLAGSASIAVDQMESGTKDLVVLEKLAAAQSTASGDPILVESAAAISRAAQAQDKISLGWLASGHAALKKGKTLYEEDRIAEARDELELANRQLARGKSPFALWASFYLAVCRYYQGELDQAERDLHAQLEAASSRRYRLLRFRTEWVIGLISAVRGDFAGSLTRYRLALEGFEQMRESGNLAVMHTLIAEDYSYLGDSVSAWRHRRQALDLMPSVENPLQRHLVVAEASYASLRDDLPWIGIHLLSPGAVGAPPYDSTPIDRSESELLRAQLQQRLGRSALALESLMHARQTLPQLSDSSVAARARADILLSEGQIVRASRPRVAEKSLTEALRYFKGAGLEESRSPEIYLERGRALMSLGRPDLAEKDLLAGIETFERQRSLQADFRIPYFERAWELFAEMIRLQVDALNRPEAALAFAERARARDLLARFEKQDSTETRSLEPASIRSSLPAHVALIYYSLQPDRLFLWTVTRERFEFASRSISASQISIDARRYRDALEKARPLAELKNLSGALYDDLVRPVVPFLPAHGVLVFLPEGPLHEIPFASLFDRQTGQYLVQTHPVAVSPSGTLFVRACERLRELSRSRLVSVLVVGNPLVAATSLPSLADLPAAEEEAAAVARLYPHSVLLVGADATANRFRELALDYEVVHFAGHAIANPTFPSLSRLVFAPDPAHALAGDVFAYQLYSYSFPHTRLAVLSACETGSGNWNHSEGTLSLARPFLAASVPQVAATLWRVDDRATSELLRRFHTEVSAGLDAVSALRNAQLGMIAATDVSLRSPSRWAGVELIGAAGEHPLHTTEGGLQ
jgi:CHAT domain-containing protein